MSSPQVESLLEGSGGAGPGGGGRRALAHNTNSNFTKKHTKHDNTAANHNTKFNRKRPHNQIAGSGGGKFHLPHKKRRSQTSMYPTKFLLGGNICDPLNLGSLQDEEINRAMNAVTPKSSPLPTPKHRKGEIEVIIPPNINDPLNLNSCENDEEYVAQLAKTSPLKRPKGKSKQSKRKRKRISSSSQCKDEVVEGSACDEPTPAIEPPAPAAVPAEAETALATVPSETASSRISLDLQLNLEIPAHDASVTTLESPTKKAGWQRRSDEMGKDRRPRKLDLKDKIVSPVIWQPLHPRLRHKGGKKEAKQKTQPKFNPKSAAFQYGNYNRYYGYRNVLHAPDVRLKCFSNFPDIFKDKDVLDIGCNIGHITLSVGRDFRARSVIGVDIDRSLIKIARKNVQHYVNYEQSPATRGTPHTSEEQSVDDKGACHSHERFFPISMPIVFGPVDIPGLTDGMGSKAASAAKPFPRNISFVQGNYVLESDSLLALEKPQFDVILCLSMTKWIHLNWGDAGLKRAFRRMYAQLRPGGRLILEPQGWPSYKRKKNLTETVWKNFQSISFFPHQFRSYLLSAEVGFTNYQVLDVPHHSSKGFRRPITMFFKPSVDSDKQDATTDASDSQNREQTVTAADAESLESRDLASTPVCSETADFSNNQNRGDPSEVADTKSPESRDLSSTPVCSETADFSNNLNREVPAEVADTEGPESSNSLTSECSSRKTEENCGETETGQSRITERTDIGDSPHGEPPESNLSVEEIVAEKDCEVNRPVTQADEAVTRNRDLSNDGVTQSEQCEASVEPNRTEEVSTIPPPPRLDG